MVIFVNVAKCSDKLRLKISLIAGAPHLLSSDRPSSPLPKKKRERDGDQIWWCRIKELLPSLLPPPLSVPTNSVSIEAPAWLHFGRLANKLDDVDRKDEELDQKEGIEVQSSLQWRFLPRIWRWNQLRWSEQEREYMSYYY